MNNKEKEGMNIVWLGSSVTIGAANNDVSMADYIAENEKWNCFKYAISGTTLADYGPKSYVARLKQITVPDNCDVFICQLSTNDASQNKPLGAISEGYDIDGFDTKTVCGAIEYIIAYAKEKWDPVIAFYTNPRYNSENYAKMVSSLLKIREKWGIEILDIWNDCSLNDMSDEVKKEFLGKYMADAIHPNYRGYKEWWTPLFTDFIKKISK